MASKIISIFIALQLLITLLNCRNIPTIALYYESLCPGCEEFIGTSVKTFQNFKGHENLATLKFYPYGNARETQDGNKWKFSCQHGAPECQGNLVESCAIKKMQPEMFTNFLVCIKENISSQGNDFIKTTKICETDSANYNAVMACVNGDEGNAVQHDIAVATEGLKPAHKWVPWVVVDGVYDSDVQDQLSDDMLGYICDNYSDIPQVKEACKNHSKSNEKNQINGFCLNNKYGFLKDLFVEHEHPSS